MNQVYIRDERTQLKVRELQTTEYDGSERFSYEIIGRHHGVPVTAEINLGVPGMKNTDLRLEEPTLTPELTDFIERLL